MPISPLLRRVLTDGKISPTEVQSLKKDIAAGKIKGAELVQLTKQFGDLFQTGAGAALLAISPKAAHVTISAPIRSIGDSRVAAEVLAGTRTVGPKSTNKEATLVFQRALNALGSRMDKPAWALVGAGADGGFGKESTAAVSAFQTDNALPVTGFIDQATALKMESLMMDYAPPEVGGVIGSGLPVPNGNRIADAARKLVETRAVEYGVDGTWKSPNPKVPGNKVPNSTPLGATGRWKCNLFCMDALYAGGAKPPQYPGGSYPIAIEIPNYSRGANAPLIKLGQVSPLEGDPAAVQAQIEALMKIARPGDVIIVNHPGTNTADGGHTRIVVANNFAKDGTLDCAQASQAAALIRAEPITRFTSEETFYLLRPATTR